LILLDGDPPTAPTGHSSPSHFPAHVYCIAKRLYGAGCHLVYGGRPRPRPHCVRWTQLPQKKGRVSQFLARVCCGQPAGWIKMPLGREVGFGPVNIVRWGPSFPKKRVQQPPILAPRLLWPNGWMDQDATWCGGSSRPTPHCVRWGTSSDP